MLKIAELYLIYVVYFLVMFLVKTTNHVEMKANESCSTVIRSNGSSSGDGVVTEVNEAYTSTKNEALYEECDNFQRDSSTFISTTENVAYGQQGGGSSSK